MPRPLSNLPTFTVATLPPGATVVYPSIHKVLKRCPDCRESLLLKDFYTRPRTMKLRVFDGHHLIGYIEKRLEGPSVYCRKCSIRRSTESRHNRKAKERLRDLGADNAIEELEEHERGPCPVCGKRRQSRVLVRQPIHAIICRGCKAALDQVKWNPETAQTFWLNINEHLKKERERDEEAFRRRGGYSGYPTRRRRWHQFMPEGEKAFPHHAQCIVAHEDWKYVMKFLATHPEARLPIEPETHGTDAEVSS